MTQKQRLWHLAGNWHKLSHKRRASVKFDDYFRAVFYLLPSPAKCTDNCLALGIKHIKDTLGTVGDQLLNAAFDHIDRRRYNEFGRELFKCDRIEELVILVQKYEEKRNLSDHIGYNDSHKQSNNTLSGIKLGINL